VVRSHFDDQMMTALDMRIPWASKRQLRESDVWLNFVRTPPDPINDRSTQSSVGLQTPEYLLLSNVIAKELFR